MSHRYFGAIAVLLLFASISSAQADQAAKAEKQKTANGQAKDVPQKENVGDAIAALMGGAPIDKEAAERGRKIFVPACGFCHGNDAHGKSGPDLVRSALVLHDNKGDVIGPIIRNGRPERGMPPFSAFSAEQIADISTFLHSRAADVTNRFAYKIGDLITGDAHKGAAFFNGDGHCMSCHSPTGDPAPSLIDVFLGRAVAPGAPTKVTVQLASGERVSGVLDHLDEFTVSMHDAAGWYRSFSRESVTVDLQDPRAAHEGLLPKYSDQEMHDVFAYLETLK